LQKSQPQVPGSVLHFEINLANLEVVDVMHWVLSIVLAGSHTLSFGYVGAVPADVEFVVLFTVSVGSIATHFWPLGQPPALLMNAM
jgi:hypothetical protein